jgi:hypothetical protein
MPNTRWYSSGTKSLYGLKQNPRNHFQNLIIQARCSRFQSLCVMLTRVYWFLTQLNRSSFRDKERKNNDRVGLIFGVGDLQEGSHHNIIFLLFLV